MKMSEGELSFEVEHASFLSRLLKLTQVSYVRYGFVYMRYEMGK